MRRLVGGAGVQIKGIIWVGSATDDRQATAAFFTENLGLRMSVNVPGFTQLVAENGDRLELFGPDSAEHDQLGTGPVAGLWVDNVDDAHQELQTAGVTDLTPIERGRDGHGWFYFKAPDGNYYELCEHPRPRPAKGGR
jgi:catechol 2,3-dioxygenase-like lactoylglutathione lyase family enzyme